MKDLVVTLDQRERAVKVAERQRGGFLVPLGSWSAQTAALILLGAEQAKAANADLVAGLTTMRDELLKTFPKECKSTDAPQFGWLTLINGALALVEGTGQPEAAKREQP